MIPNYQVRFRDTAGNVVLVLAGTGSDKGGLSSIACERVVNGIGTHAVTLRGDLSVVSDIGLDYQVEIWRRPVGSSLWVLAYGGFHRTWTWQSDANGDELFTSYGFCFNSLLARRIVDAYSGTAGAAKSGKAETVIKAYVDENAGPGAAAGRAFPGLTIQADGASGNNWEGERSWRSLMEVCQDIAYAGGGDFQIVGTEPAKFEFQWHSPQLGTSRIIGTTDPVVFSLQRNNIINPVLSINHGQEFNYIYVLGPGEGLTRTVLGVSDATSILASPWNRLEVSRQSTDESTVSGLASAGAAELQNGLSTTSMGFTVVQTPGCVYGVHYFLGDIVSAIYHQRVDRKIAKVKLDISADKENVQVELADVSR